MAPLYKRYIPPPKSTAPAANGGISVAPVAPVAPVTVSHGQQENGRDRKRQRSEAEIAERKAKKLRGKESQVAEASIVLPSNESHATAPDTREQPDHYEISEQQGDQATGEPHESRGEFSHIKNTKKRHKLEKEARKARKAAEKGTNAQPNPPVSTEPGVKEIERVIEAEQDGNEQQYTEDQPISAMLGSPAGDERTQNDKDGTTTSVNGLVQQDTPKSKKRRHRLESVLEERAQSTESNQEQDHLQKHGAVLNKFQKSARRQRTIQPQPQLPERQSFEAPKVQDLVIPEPTESQDVVAGIDSALPSWLAHPTVISNEHKSTFAALELEAKTLDHLAKLGFEEALPVQQALIPLLLPPDIRGSRHLPGTEACLPDLAVSAPTGSGKTIAYLVPILESLKKAPDSGSLRALVVVPTRELVMQVAAVCESLSKGTSIKYGTATGSGSFRDESNRLVKQQRRYDPAGYRELLEMAHRQNHPDLESSNDVLFLDISGDTNGEESKLKQKILDTVTGLVDHVPVYTSAVDILIATPGRLMEHLARTQGLSLSHLEWLVLDEADRLLDSQNDGLIQTIRDHTSKPVTGVNSATRGFGRPQRLRKVMLSATMTKDISKLVDLNLQRPRLIVVRGDKQSGDSALSNAEASVNARGTDGDFELPTTLREFSVHVGDGSEKPLYLIELLRRKILSTSRQIGNDDLGREVDGDDDTESDSDSSDSDSSSDSDQDSSTDAASSESSSSESASDDGSSASSHDDESEASDADVPASRSLATIHPDRATLLDKSPNAVPTILIFTSSTESANRLAYLLKALRPDLTEFITTMTRSNSRSSNTHSHTSPQDPIITISTDRASRGLDTIGTRPITHVVQYDVPRSATSYVHRVGRTARAGRSGEAWTLFTHTEARWFAKAILRTKQIKRLSDVEKAKLPAADDDAKEALARAVAEMREEVMAPRRGR